MKTERSTIVEGSDIEGVELKSLQVNADHRGDFTEVFQEHWKNMERPCQWSIVNSSENVLRGCHLHKRHDEYFCLLQGEVSLGLRDERPWSPTYGHWQLYRLFGHDMTALIFPAGLLHGWYFHSQSLHLQSVSESYTTYGGDDNWGVHWSDPDLEIPWPFENPALSEHAAEFASLASLREKLLPWDDITVRTMKVG